ncbi:MAG TPA: hypothetical protein VGO47_09995 [Chlamydiales bacterium]|nr:hypothetical protein [Chlamydiales bacterium]
MSLLIYMQRFFQKIESKLSRRRSRLDSQETAVQSSTPPPTGKQAPEIEVGATSSPNASHASPNGAPATHPQPQPQPQAQKVNVSCSTFF